MAEILKTTLLEYDKSTFIIDLIKHVNGQLYIEVEQIIHFANHTNQAQKIKINPSILDDIIATLRSFEKVIPKRTKSAKNYFSNDRKEEVKRRYFKGISIKDLALQFDCSEKIIEQILSNDGIEIVSNEIPKQRSGYRYKKRRNS